MHILTEELWFPKVNEANEDGIVAIGGDLSINRLMLAYKSGIFPWYESGQPIIWWSPDPRMVLIPSELKISKSLQRVLNANPFKVTFNTSFSEVITNCSKIKRSGQNGTWITPEMILAYKELHALGFAQSVEVWQDKDLVGGLYGIDLADKGIFCGESMFNKQSNASKVGFCTLVSKLIENDYKLIDCQVYTDHLNSLGAKEISRCDFMRYFD